ncbi:hypothetical protein CQW23_13745 [Capsicum baccatum]|uniref:Uncharacterized protein n=1 Tax=Capsicum baccatum TaxID=33114 RepID=A0A2G2WH55_CAPBA|nr:hypothetical protein CQW23_13745 [Capsicum baccatum]
MLEEILPSFGDICSLKIIKLVKSPQLEDSVVEIKQHVEDITGEDKLQILGEFSIVFLLRNQIYACCLRCVCVVNLRHQESSTDKHLETGVERLLFLMIKMLMLHLASCATAQHGYRPPSLMSTLLLFLCQEYSRYPLLILTIRSIESFWGGTFKSIKYRIDELDEEKSVI